MSNLDLLLIPSIGAAVLLLIIWSTSIWLGRAARRTVSR
jgi:hypothetical protein